MNKKHKIWQSHVPGSASAVAVIKDPNNPHDKGDIAFALRFWKRGLKESGKLFEYKSRKEYIKKPQVKREKMNAAKFNQWVKDKNQD